MNHLTAILWPMAALAGLTFAVLSLVPVFRIGDVRAGRVRPSDFRFGESDRVPEATRLCNRNYMNLLELPILFYVICLIIYVTGHVLPSQIILAWAFVAFRVGHSVVHLTVNQVLLRLACFGLSVTSLVGLWVFTFWQIAVP